MKERRPAVSSVEKAIPQIQPTLEGGTPAGVELMPSMVGAMQGMQTTFENSVANEFLANETFEEAQEGAEGGALAPSTAAGATAPPEDTSSGTDGDQVAEGKEAEGAAQIAEKTGGSALPADAKDKLSQVLPDVDLGSVELFENESAVKDIDAGGAAIGNRVFLAGSLDTSSPEGLALLAEEVAHTSQAGPSSEQEGVMLGGTSNAAEQDAGKVYDAVLSGEQAPGVSESHDGNTIQRGEAGTHKADQTLPALGVDDPGFNPESDQLSQDQQRALQVYAGNFMSDFSQANVPLAIDMISNIPGVGSGGETIGREGASEIIQGIISAFAILELGKDAAQVVTSGNTEVYEAERHMDNPMGTSGAGYATDSRSNAGTHGGDADTPAWECIATTDHPEAKLRTDVAGTNATHSGSASPGLQYENPSLYEASSGGLSNFIYNSVEASKTSYTTAAEQACMGNMDEARMHVGYGDHPVQDYFSHTNYIEVCLNKYINTAMDAGNEGVGAPESDEGRDYLIGALEEDGPQRAADEEEGVSAQWVSTLYEGQVEGEDGSQRDVITAGTFGGTDTAISIAHTFLPLIPKLHAGMMTAVDQFVGLIKAASPGEDGPSLLETLTNQGNEGAAMSILLQHMDTAGVALPTPTGVSLGWTEIAISPGLFGDPWTMDVPNGELNVDMENQEVIPAITTALGTYQQFKSVTDEIDKYAKWIGLTAIRNMIRSAWNLVFVGFQASIKQAMNQVIAGIVVAITNELTGQEMSAEEYSDATGEELDSLLSKANDAMHGAEEHTSLNERMSATGAVDGGQGDLYDATVAGTDEAKAALERMVGPVTGSGTEADPWRPVNPIPPSHSEISKDHPAHESETHEGRTEGGDHDHDQEGHTHGEGEHAGGSAFYGISNELAKEACRHIYKEMEAVFKEATGNHEMMISEQASARRDQEMVNQDHEAMLAEASGRAGEESERAREAGYAHRQTDDTDHVEQVPSLTNLHNLLDLFVCHPEDSSWWFPVIDKYVGAHAEEVHAHILRRNGQGAANR